jgi:hypothetical protein
MPSVGFQQQTGMPNPYRTPPPVTGFPRSLEAPRNNCSFPAPFFGTLYFKKKPTVFLVIQARHVGPWLLPAVCTGDFRKKKTIPAHEDRQSAFSCKNAQNRRNTPVFIKIIVQNDQFPCCHPRTQAWILSGPGVEYFRKNHSLAPREKRQRLTLGNLVINN